MTEADFSLDPGPIFRDPGREFHRVTRVRGTHRVPGGVDVRAATAGGDDLTIRLTFFAPQVLRLQFHAAGGSLDRTSPMLVARSGNVQVRVQDTREAVRMRAGELQVICDRHPFALRVQDGAGRTIFAQFADRSFDRFVTHRMGYTEDRASGRRHVYESFRLWHGEHLYGLGERYGPIDRRGLRTVLWCVDTHGTNSTDLVYKPVPFFLSTAGYGMFMHSHARVTVDLGAYSAASGWIYVEEPVLDYFLIYGPALRDILRRYLVLTGQVPVPPRWSFGIWLSRCMYRDRAEVERVVAEGRQRGFPFDVVHLDPLWLKGRKTRNYDSSDLVWDEHAFGPPREFIQTLRKSHVRLSLWENPYFPMQSERFAEAARAGHFLRDAGSGLARFRGKDAAVVDFTSSKTVEWFKALHRDLLKSGVAAFKTDYGEEVPGDAVAGNGMAGQELHNLFPLLYNRAVFEEMSKADGQAAVWARSGWAGSQRYPVHWSGDAPSRWDTLPLVLQSGLSLMLSGFAFWSHDIGGFYGLSDDELFIRWAQLGLLSTHARFHGKEPREPWAYPRAFEIIRRYAQLRYRLLPYLYSEAIASTRAGLPLMRPLVLEFQDDPNTATIGDQYLLGDTLMIAPVLTKHPSRRVYLPAGQWWDFWRGTRYAGSQWLTVHVPIDTVPIFVRDNTVLPLGSPIMHADARPDPWTFEIRTDTTARYELQGLDEPIDVRARVQPASALVGARGGAGRHHLRVLGIESSSLEVRGRAELRGAVTGPWGTELTLDTRGMYEVRLSR
jgi:alpha-D-xyloside xylohydrolase